MRFENFKNFVKMKEIIFSESAPKPVGPYSQAVKVGNLMFLSGQIPLIPETGKFVEGGIKEQTEQVLKNITAVLAAAGCSFENIVKTTCFLSDISNFAAMNEVYKTYFSENFPARSTYAVAGLPLGALIEIEVIASK